MKDKINQPTMNKGITKITLVTAGAVLFNLVFWQEKLGVNVLLFDAFILAALFYLYPSAGQSSTVRWLIAGHLLCLAMIIVHNTLLSKIAFSITLLLIAAFAEYVHRSVWFAGGSVLLNILLVAASFAEQWQVKYKKKIKRRSISRFTRFAIIPLLLLVIFFIIYSSANSVFNEFAQKTGAQLSRFFANFFGLFSWNRALFLLSGLVVTGSILLKSRAEYFSRKEKKYKDDLTRIKKSWRVTKGGFFFSLVEIIMGRFANGILALKNENTTGIIILLLLNLLLLTINVIDISYLWVNFEYDGNEPIYKMVHEGTGWLIFSIVLAMAVLLFFFKGNLNFYKRNRWLKYGATAWILQNSLLAVSVLLRDYYYIERHGLAYKRIGVLFFLLMVLIGLVTVFIKIWHKRSSYYLFRINAWAGILILVLSTSIHWDEFIAGYNLQRKEKISPDVDFLLSLSDKTLPLLEKNKDVLQKRQVEVEQERDYRYSTACDTCYLQKLEKRKEQFVEKQEKLSWLSWNYADAYTKQYFRKTRLPATLSKN